MDPKEINPLLGKRRNTYTRYVPDDVSIEQQSTSSANNTFRDLRAWDKRKSSSSGEHFSRSWVHRQSLPHRETLINMDYHSDSKDDDDESFGSKPATRRNSDASLLDDVCFPLDDNEGVKNWPDLAVLEEFTKEETERLRAEASQEAAQANMKYDSMSDAESDLYSSQVGFSHPLVTKVDVPSLGNRRVNDAEPMNGRLRPPKINPFAKRQFGKGSASNAEFLKTINYPPHIVNNNPDHFRFTYFREDLDSTVHSPTISGLLQPGQDFGDLFKFMEYTKKRSKTPTAPGSVKDSFLKDLTQGNSTPSGTPADRTPSVDNRAESLDNDRISPFWLDVLNPTEEEMKVLSKAFQIHPLTTEDIFLGETREKVELFKDYYFVCFRSFDIVQERAKQKQNDTAKTESMKHPTLWEKLFRNQASAKSAYSVKSETSSMRRRRKHVEREKYQRKSGEKHKPKNNELEPLNVYTIVFRHAVLTFHFAPTPHTVNVRRRARILREYLTVSADWIAYALIDDITDAFGPMIESIEDEVNDIEDSILRMHTGNDSSDDDSDDESDVVDYRPSPLRKGSTVDARSLKSVQSVSVQSTRSTNSNVIEWRKKGDLLKRIGETRTRVMALLRLLGSKVDVIKGFAKRCNEQWEVAPRSEIGMYLGDIQDHIVTMVQSLNHYEKLLARSHSNYLAQINIDMTRVNNDMNDVLGKISLLGTVVLPMNIITGLWGMNVLVPGQDNNQSLVWFWSITCGMFFFATCGYIYMKRISGLD